MISIQRWFSKNASIGSSALLALTLITPHHAPIEEAGLTELITEATPQTVASADRAAEMTSDGYRHVSENAGSEVVVPTQAKHGSEISTGASELNLSLPFSNQADEIAVESGGIYSYDNKNGSVSVPVVLDDGSVQVNTVIDSPTAPLEYSYGVESDSFGSIVATGSSLLILDDQGDYLAGVAPAWARDASGRDVPTRYEIDGSRFVQVVEHSSEYDYPIVADPWIGIPIWKSITVDSYSGQARVNLTLSDWGNSIWWGVGIPGLGIPGGQAILNTAGWDEAWSKGGTIRTALDKPSMRQQFECHALGSPAAGTWNLEKFRPNRTISWYVGAAFHRCNWVRANQVTAN